MPPQGPPTPHGAGLLFVWITRHRAKFYAVVPSFTPGAPLFLQLYIYNGATLIRNNVTHKKKTRNDVIFFLKPIDITRLRVYNEGITRNGVKYNLIWRLYHGTNKDLP